MHKKYIKQYMNFVFYEFTQAFTKPGRRKDTSTW